MIYLSYFISTILIKKKKCISMRNKWLFYFPRVNFWRFLFIYLGVGGRRSLYKTLNSPEPWISQSVVTIEFHRDDDKILNYHKNSERVDLAKFWRNSSETNNFNSIGCSNYSPITHRDVDVWTCTCMVQLLIMNLQKPTHF